jgi:hypothetical protein
MPCSFPLASVAVVQVSINVDCCASTFRIQVVISRVEKPTVVIVGRFEVERWNRIVGLESVYVSGQGLMRIML